MKGHRVATVSCPRPIRGPTGDGDLLAAEKRSVTDHGASTALALQAMHMEMRDGSPSTVR